MKAVPLERVRKGESQQVLLEVVLDSEGEQEPADPRRGDTFQTAGTEGGQARLARTSVDHRLCRRGQQRKTG